MTQSSLEEGPQLEAPAGSRRGRPPATSARALEVVALELFSHQGFADTTIEEISQRAGVSSRTFFRYFSAKADVLWHGFDAEVEALRQALAAIGDNEPLMDAIRSAVVAVNHYTAEDVPELRTRMQVINSSPALLASASLRYAAWERVVSEYAAERLSSAPDSLVPLAVGRATLATCRAAYDQWAARADTALTTYLDIAIRSLASGFSDDVA